MITEERMAKALQTLWEQDQLVLLVQIAEKWSIKKDLSARLCLLEAQAFINLCLLEHAWRRLQSAPDGKLRRELAVEILLKRGWVSKARTALIALQTLAPNHPRLEEFHKRLQQGVRPPSNAEEILRSGSSFDLVRLAEQYLCFGKNLVGQKILIRVLQKDAQNHMAQRLLWAQRGDFTSSLSLSQLYQQISFEELEVDIETTVANPGQLIENATHHKSTSFPALFRGMAEVDLDELTAEVTNAFVFSDVGDQVTQRFDDFSEDERETVALDYVPSSNDFEGNIEPTNSFDRHKFAKESNDEEVIFFTEQEPKTTEIGLPPRVFDKTMEVIEKIPQPPPNMMPTASVQSKQQKEPRPSTGSHKLKKKKMPSWMKGAIFSVVVVLLLLAVLVVGMQMMAK